MEAAALQAVASLGSKKRKREGPEIRTIAKTNLGFLLSDKVDSQEKKDQSNQSIHDISSIPLTLSGNLKSAPILKDSSSRKGRSTKEENKDWFGMKAKTAGEITQEMKRDLLVLANRAYLDPKRKYKTKSEDKGRMGGGIPRFFEIGTVVESTSRGRISNLPTREPLSKAKAEHSSLVAGLLADETFRKYAKKTSEAVRKRSERSRSHVQPNKNKSFKSSSSFNNKKRK